MPTAILAETPQLTDVRLLISIDSSGIRLTPDEFDSLGDCHWDRDYHYELVHGVLIAVPPISEGERGPNELLGHLLWQYQQTHPQGAILDETFPENLINTPDSRRRADRVVWTGLGRTPRVRVDVPSIAIEFVSAGKRSFERDYIEKRDEYLDTGVIEFWIIDRFERRMTVVRRTDGDLDEVTINAQGVYSTPLLPRFELPLSVLLGKADDLTSASGQ